MVTMGIDIFSVVGLAVVSALFCLLLRQYRPEFALSASVVCGVLLFLTIVSQMTPIFDVIREILGRIENGNSYVTVIMKSLGICYITQLASDSCNDAGEKAIAGRIELAGRVAILISALPMFTALLQIALNLIG